MKLLEICKDPKKAGREAFEQGMSVHASPFRNTNGYVEENALWHQGHEEAREKALFDKRGKQ